jgi:proteasome accessory factor B
MLRVGRADPNEPFTRNFATVAQGWADGRVIEFDYEPSGGGERRHARVRPYFLEPDAAGRSVYLIGHDETVDAMRTLKVERMRNATVTTDRYEIPDEFDPDRWLAHSWGIWSSDTTEVAEVRLRFDAGVAQRVRESVWHRSQQITELPDGRLELTVSVAGIVEIRPWILSWGDAVEVLEPAALRESVANAVRGAAARYPA